MNRSTLVRKKSKIEIIVNKMTIHNNYCVEKSSIAPIFYCIFEMIIP